MSFKYSSWNYMFTLQKRIKGFIRYITSCQWPLHIKQYITFTHTLCNKNCFWLLLNIKNWDYLVFAAGSGAERPNGILPRIRFNIIHRFAIPGRIGWVNRKRIVHIRHTTSRCNPWRHSCRRTSTSTGNH